MQNCLFMNQIEQNEKIAKSFSKLKYCGDNHNYQTKSAARKLLDTPCFSTNLVHNQPNIVVSLTGTILKNNSPH